MEQKKPEVIKINGERWVAQTFLIVSETTDGKPKICRMIRDDEEVDLEGGEKFLVVYALEKTVR